MRHFTCVASGMGRGNHVAAVLFALLDYIETFGTDKQSSTSSLVNGTKDGDPKRHLQKYLRENIPNQIKRRKFVTL